MSQFDEEQLEQYRKTGLTPMEINMLKEELAEIESELRYSASELIKAQKELAFYKVINAS